MVSRLPGTRRRSRVIGTAAVVIVVLVILANLARFYTDVLWFNSVGFSSVLWKSIRTQFLLGTVVGVLFGSVVWANLYLAGRLTPAYWRLRFSTERPDPFEEIRTRINPYIKWAQLGVSGVVAVFAGAAASSTWKTYLLWVNRVDFGVVDPQFHKDVGFFVFVYPFYQDILGWLWGALLVALLLTGAAHFFYGSFDPSRGWRGIAPRALAHISVLLGLLALVKAGQYWLGRYGLDFSSRGAVTGATYTDVHAQLPAITLLAFISIVSAALFLVNIRVRRLSLPLAAVAIWVLIAVLAGAVWPLVVQRLSVKPQELQREAPYIKRNIEFTRKAFGLAHIKSQNFAAASDLTADQARSNADVLNNVRLWDPDILQTVENQVQAIQSFYKFPDVDIDRYPVAGQERQILLSARELALNDLPASSRTWQNVHLRYTHGYGLVANLANEATSSGEPDFIVKNVPPQIGPGGDSLDAGQPRLYFGENFTSSEYSIVDSKQSELDFPTQTGTSNFHYSDGGGIPLGGFLDRIAFAIREGDPNLILSGLIQPRSKILIYRDVADRVHRAAPFLSIDRDPYPAVVGGRLEWIVDAYTSTNLYPYSERFDMSNLLPAAASDGPAPLTGKLSYIRNSVKVVVDAYSGKMTFYTVPGAQDPLLQAWKRAFPALFSTTPPPDDLQAHFRYPEDLFSAQSTIWTTYHMSSPSEFYSKRDQWAIADNAQNLTAAAEAAGGTTIASLTRLLPPKVTPTYLLFRLPGQSDQEFMLTVPYTRRSRPNMVGELVARNDPPNYGDLVTLKFGTGFVQGPVQVDNLINQDVRASKAITLLSRSGSRIDFGSLVILPIQNSLLYIQPIFVTASAGGGIPELKKVAVVLGSKVVLDDTFNAAINRMFGLQGGGTTQPTPSGGGNAGGNKGGGLGAAGNPQLSALLQQAGRLYSQAQQALQQGDFARYGQLTQKLGRVIAKAKALSSSSGSRPTGKKSPRG